MVAILAPAWLLVFHFFYNM